MLSPGCIGCLAIGNQQTLKGQRRKETRKYTKLQVV